MDGSLIVAQTKKEGNDIVEAAVNQVLGNSESGLWHVGSSSRDQSSSSG